MGRGIALLVLALVACEPMTSDVFLALPPAPDAQRMAFSVPGASDEPELVVIDPLRPHGFVLSFEVADVTPAIEVLAYDEDVLPVGVVEGAPAGEVGAALPTPDDVFRLSVEDGAASWVTAERSQTASFRRRICAPIVTRTTSWDVDGFVRFAVSVDDDTVLFSTSDSTSVVLYRSNGGEPERILPSVAVRDAPRSVWRAQGDRVWFGDYGGRVHRARVTAAGFVDVEEVFDFERPFALVTGIDGHVAEDGTVEVFAVDDAGDVAHFDGRAFTKLPESFVAGDPRVAWRAPGEAIVVALETNAMAKVARRRVISLGGLDDNVFAIANVPAVGIVIGTQSGAFRVLQGDVWEQLGAAFSTYPLAIRPTEDGFVYLIASGRVGRYYTGAGFCPNEGVLPVLGFAGVLAPLGEDYFVAGELNSAAGVTQGARIGAGR